MRKPSNIIIGVTGSFGSGKSTVSRLFVKHGARILDADRIARRLLESGTPVYEKIIRIFGRKILDKSKKINRKKLAAIVFENKRLLASLNKIVHPEVVREIKNKIKGIKKGVIVLDAALLIEAGLKNKVDKLVVVNLNRKKQLERLRDKKGVNKSLALKIIKSQIPLRRKLRLADFIIDNNGSLNKTRKQVVEIRRKLWKS
jgi:dephospho-CoA kinase